MLGELFFIGLLGFEVYRRPALRKKAGAIARKLPGASMYLFEKGVSATSSYLINAWSDVRKMKPGGGEKC